MMSVRDLICLAVQALPYPSEWQVTILPSHFLVYKEVNEVYPRMKVIWPLQSSL